MKIIPRHIASPKIVQYCQNCNKIYDWSTSICIVCDIKLNRLEYISYLLSIHNDDIIKICPCCNSYDFDLSERQTSIDRWENGFSCNNCSKNFKFAKNVDKKKWFLENFPELLNRDISDNISVDNNFSDTEIVE